jgi:hypothetical protein
MRGSRVEEMTAATGYHHASYASALARQRPVLRLPASQAILIVRAIPGCAAEDAAAPYPFLCCRDWNRLPGDMAELPRALVSVTAVTDPFADVGEAILRASFNHLVRPYKEHWIIDLTRPLESFAHARNLARARKALNTLCVDSSANPIDHADEWLRLYADLVERHAIGAAARMTEGSLRRQLLVPGARIFRATCDGETVGMIIVMEGENHAYFHLGAYSREGYRRNASYALVASVLRHYADAGFREMSIGAGAGVTARSDDGLTQFKRKWASGSRMTYLCGHVVDAARYRELARRAPDSATGYFPAYRAGEFD